MIIFHIQLDGKAKGKGIVMQHSAAIPRFVADGLAFTYYGARMDRALALLCGQRFSSE